MYLLHIPFRCSDFFIPSKKNSFGCAASRKIGKPKAPLSIFLVMAVSDNDATLKII
jgi:hypothetical protein